MRSLKTIVASISFILAATAAQADGIGIVAKNLAAKALNLATSATTSAAAANSAIATVAANVTSGPTLLIKPGTGTFPSTTDTYFTGRKSLYTLFDGVRMNQTSFFSLLTPSRASTATYFDNTGTMQTAASGAARLGYTYNGSAWVLGGLIVEPQATNLLLQSTALTSASWTVIAGVSVTATAGTAPDGTNTAFKAVESSGGSYHYFRQALGTQGTTYSFSFFAKPGERTWMAAALGDSNYLYLNLSTGAVGTISGPERRWWMVPLYRDRRHVDKPGCLLLLCPGERNHFLRRRRDQWFLCLGTAVRAELLFDELYPDYLSNCNSRRRRPERHDRRRVQSEWPDGGAVVEDARNRQ